MCRLNSQQSLEIVLGVIVLAVVAAIAGGVYLLFWCSWVPVQHGYWWESLVCCGFWVLHTARRVWKHRGSKPHGSGAGAA